MKDVLRILVTIAVLVGFALTIRKAVEHARPAQSQGETAAPERVITAVATATTGPVFELPRGRAVYRLITFMHLPEEISREVYEPMRRHEYGLSLRVIGPSGEVLREQDVWFVTRKSKAQPTSSGWRRQSAYYPIGDRGEPCDPRMLDVDLEAWAGDGHQLEIRAIDAEVNLVAYASFDRSPSRVDWMMRTTRPVADARDHAHQIRSWVQLDDRELRGMLASGWQRQTSVSPAPVRDLFSTDFRVELDETVMHGEALRVGRPLAYNIVGPARVSFAVWSPSPTPVPIRVTELSFTGASVEFEERTVGVDARRNYTDFLDAVVDGDFAVTVPKGVRTTVTVESRRSGARLLAAVSEPEGMAGEHPMLQAPSGAVLVRPDYLNFSLWHVDAQPLRFRVGAGGVGGGQAVVVAARRRPEGPPQGLWYRFDDGARWPLRNDGRASAFETVLPETQGPSDEPLSVTEPVYNRIWVPEGAQTLEIFAGPEGGNQWVTVSLVSIDANASRELREPYSEPPPGAAWRYAEYARHPWQTIAPDDAGRGRQEREWQAQAQARWEPDFSSVVAMLSLDELRGQERFDVPEQSLDEEEGPTRVIGLRRARSSVVLEPLDRWSVGRWTETHRVRLTSNGEPVGCESERSRVLLHGGLGSTYTVQWGDLPLRRRVLRTRADQFTVSSATGPGELGIVSDGEPMEAWVSCEPTDRRAADVWRMRRTYRLDTDRPLTMKVQPESDTWNLNVIVYGPASGALRASFDDGAPDRRDGAVEQFTFATREFEWSDSAITSRLVTDPSQRLSAPLRFVVPVGNDLADGAHELKLEWLGDPSDVAYVRFFRR